MYGYLVTCIQTQNVVCVHVTYCLPNHPVHSRARNYFRGTLYRLLPRVVEHERGITVLRGVLPLIRRGRGHLDALALQKNKGTV